MTPLSKIRKRCLFLVRLSSVDFSSHKSSLTRWSCKVSICVSICIQRPFCLDHCTSLLGARGYRLPFQALSVYFPQVTRITHTHTTQPTATSGYYVPAKRTALGLLMFLEQSPNFVTWMRCPSWAGPCCPHPAVEDRVYWASRTGLWPVMTEHGVRGEYSMPRCQVSCHGWGCRLATRASAPELFQILCDLSKLMPWSSENKEWASCSIRAQSLELGLYD